MLCRVIRCRSEIISHFWPGAVWCGSGLVRCCPVRSGAVNSHTALSGLMLRFGSGIGLVLWLGMGLELANFRNIKPFGDYRHTIDCRWSAIVVMLSDGTVVYRTLN